MEIKKAEPGPLTIDYDILKITRIIENCTTIHVCENPTTGFVFYVIGGRMIADECSVLRAKAISARVTNINADIAKKIKDKQNAKKG